MSLFEGRILPFDAKAAEARRSLIQRTNASATACPVARAYRAGVM